MEKLIKSTLRPNSINYLSIFANKTWISRRFASGGKKEVIIAGVQPTPITKRKMKLKLIVPAGEAKPGPPAGPVLGQAQIPLKEFCDEFNKRTSPILQGTMLFTKVFKHARGGYDISIRAPSIVYLIKQVLADRGETKISIYDLYDIVRIRMQIEKILSSEKNKVPTFPSFHAAANCVIGTLKSMKIKIKFDE